MSCSTCDMIAGHRALGTVPPAAPAYALPTPSSRSDEGVVVVVPRRHVDRLARLTPTETIALWSQVHAVLLDPRFAYGASISVHDGGWPHVRVEIEPVDPDQEDEDA